MMDSDSDYQIDHVHGFQQILSFCVGCTDFLLLYSSACRGPTGTFQPGLQRIFLQGSDQFQSSIIKFSW